jgi:hypothetical protein
MSRIKKTMFTHRLVAAVTCKLLFSSRYPSTSRQAVKRGFGYAAVYRRPRISATVRVRRELRFNVLLHAHLNMKSFSL